MRYITLLAWALVAALAVTLVGPIMAQDDKGEGKALGKDRSDRGRASVRIEVTTDETTDNRAMQQFMGGQFRRYNSIDPVTGERISDLLQMVVEVNNGYLLVANQTDYRRSIVLTDRTRVTFEQIRGREERPDFWLTPGRPRPGDRNDQVRGTDQARGSAFVTDRLRPGDLLIAQGYLNAAGKFVGTELRVMGHADGWYDDEYASRGIRLYGEVRSVDGRRDRAEVQTNQGTRTVELARNGELLYRGREYEMRDLEKGDRVVIYADDDARTTVDAIRIVVLEDRQAYPRGDERYWADPPNWWTNDDDRDNGTWMEGNLNYIQQGALLHRLVLNGPRNRSTTFLLSKTLKVIDRDGTRISLNTLREGELLRVYYTDVDGTFFATRIEAR